MATGTTQSPATQARIQQDNAIRNATNQLQNDKTAMMIQDLFDAKMHVSVASDTACAEDPQT